MFGLLLRYVSGAAAFLLTMLAVGLGSAMPPRPSTVAAQTAEEDIPKDKPVFHILATLPSSGLVMQRAADMYQRGNPDIAVTVQTIRSHGDYKAALRAKLAANEQVDLFQVFGCRDMLELRARPADLAGLDWLEQVVEPLLEPVRLDGGVFGVPYSLEGSGIVVNLDVFDAAGIDPTALSTLEDWEEAFQAVHEKIVSGEYRERFPQLEAVTEFAAQDDEYLGTVAADFLLRGSFDNQFLTVTEQALTIKYSDSFEQLLVLFARFSSNRGDWTGLNEVAPNLLLENGIASGRVAAVLHSGGIFRRIGEVTPALEGRVALLPVPLGEADQARPAIAVGAPVYWACRADDDGAPERNAAAFLTWLYQSDEGKKLLTDDFLVLPPLSDAAGTVPVYRQLLAYLRAGQIIPQLHNELDPRWVSEALGPAIRRYFGEREYSWEAAEQDLTGGWSVDEPG